MNMERLNAVHQHLWFAGLPVCARPLHRQRIMERQVVITEQADLHLLWLESRIFIKPLPAYLLNYDFWKTNICDDVELHTRACGFLLSYAWLVSHPSDLEMAMELGLLPWKISWVNWTAFVREFFPKAGPEAVNKRYHYGELRLNRLNMIYRLTHLTDLKFLLDGYMTGYNRYSVFLYRNFSWIFGFFAYITIVLTAMQVGLGTKQLQSGSFERVSYGFTVFVMLLSLLFLVAIPSILLFLFLSNLVVTCRFHKTRKGGRSV
ncbi:uncharacterized protein K452DRAFT_288247 [Aplosporella prunicola CBS 121167]|uniref:Uncharacterized protein n=1 Tax=Aplosporella prunicola CBS 121167 TaxID=1176127 RepID=A0A6A6BD58_9PEZI|nr:uncharacterized protein K452DRAFT_288247 [Aplosporella prunicola CBS 121167]KAF2140837.1 hypothetical protein K452DRAFT_288247 [Aplosporella prunicola CBS 121167]